MDVTIHLEKNKKYDGNLHFSDFGNPIFDSSLNQNNGSHVSTVISCFDKVIFLSPITKAEKPLQIWVTVKSEGFFPFRTELAFVSNGFRLKFLFFQT